MQMIAKSAVRPLHFTYLHRTRQSGSNITSQMQNWWLSYATQLIRLFRIFFMLQKQAIEPESDFAAALDMEEKRLAAGWQPLFGYSNFPRYAEQLERYYTLFPRDQLFIRTYEDFKETPERVLADIFQFINVDPGFQPDMSKKLNAGGVPKNRALQDFLMKSNPITKAIGLVIPKGVRLAIRDQIAAVNTTKEIGMSAAARNTLKTRLGDEILALEKLIDRDLSGWLA